MRHGLFDVSFIIKFSVYLINRFAEDKPDHFGFLYYRMELNLKMYELTYLKKINLSGNIRRWRLKNSTQKKKKKKKIQTVGDDHDSGDPLRHVS